MIFLAILQVSTIYRSAADTTRGERRLSAIRPRRMDAAASGADREGRRTEPAAGAGCGQETLELLLAAQQPRALRVLRRIGSASTADGARSTVVLRAPGSVLRDDTSDHPAVLQQIVEAGFGRLAALSRETPPAPSASAVMLDHRRVEGRSFDDRLSLFIDKCPRHGGRR